MKWVLVAWTIWFSDGHSVEIKHSETYFASRLSCELAMAEFAERYQTYTEPKFGYALQCMEREFWENSR